jgi:hypothetical protein
MSDSYQRAEIERALFGTPEDSFLRVKVIGDQGESKHLNASPQQVRAIREILGGDLLAVLSEALGDAHAYRGDGEEDNEMQERYTALAMAIGVDANFDTGH